MKHIRVIACSAALVLALGACGNQGETATPATEVSSLTAPASEPTPSPQNTPEPSPATSTAPESTTTTAQLPFSDAPTTSQPAEYGSEYKVEAVSVSEDGQQVVIELSGGEAANLYWWAEYDEAPLTQGKGDPVELDGEAVLRVNVQGLAFPEMREELLMGLQPDTAAGRVTGVYVDPPFEAMSQIFIGLDARIGFYVSAEDSPTRLVIDFDPVAVG